MNANIKKSTVTLTIAALFMALNIVLSSYSIPVPGGHLYLNDVIICTAALILSPSYAFIVGGIGAFLGDFFFYPTPMFVSLVTHGLQAIVISLISHKLFKTKPVLGASVGVAVGAVIMVLGYSLGRAFIYSTPEIAITKLPFQILQAVVGAVSGVIICYPLKAKAPIEKIVNNYMHEELIAEKQRIKQEQEKIKQEEMAHNIPKCPTCGSTNIEKISSLNKAAGAVIFGLFSKTARSQFKCRNCGYKW